MTLVPCAPGRTHSGKPPLYRHLSIPLLEPVLPGSFPLREGLIRRTLGVAFLSKFKQHEATKLGFHTRPQEHIVHTSVESWSGSDVSSTCASVASRQCPGSPGSVSCRMSPGGCPVLLGWQLQGGVPEALPALGASPHGSGSKHSPSTMCPNVLLLSHHTLQMKPRPRQMQQLARVTQALSP